VVKCYFKGRYGRHTSKWFAYAVAGLPASILPAQVFKLYRQRFGIEAVNDGDISTQNRGLKSPLNRV
jgi:hypothetical protein